MATAAQDMVQGGETVIAELEGLLSGIDARMADAQAELVALHETHVKRGEAVSDARLTCQRYEAEHEQAVGYAKLAHGTIREKESIKAVSTTRKQLETAQKALARLERDTAEADQLAQARQAELEKQLHLLHFEKETRHAEMSGVASGLDKAKSELGRETYEAFLQAWQDKQSVVDALQEQLITAQADEHDCYQHALHELAAWPDLHREVARLQPAENSTSRMIESTLLYIDVFLHEIPHLEDLPREFQRRGMALWDLLVVPPDAVMTAFKQPQWLQQRHQYLTQVLEDYRAHLETLR